MDNCKLHYLVLCSQVQNLKVSQHLVKNCQFALDPVIMPSTEHSIGEFLTGSPPEITTPAEHMEAENDDSEEDIREEEVDKPPKVKRTKREMKALNIRSLQVRDCGHQNTSVW